MVALMLTLFTRLRRGLCRGTFPPGVFCKAPRPGRLISNDAFLFLSRVLEWLLLFQMHCVDVSIDLPFHSESSLTCGFSIQACAAPKLFKRLV